jgi:ankyrin repeat protein
MLREFTGLCHVRDRMLTRWGMAVVLSLPLSIVLLGQDVSLFNAAAKGDLDRVRVCIAAGADVNAKQGNGATALLLAAEEGHTKVVQALLAAGADVNASMSVGATALMLAAQNGHLEVASALLSARADVNARTTSGHTALMCASQDEGHLDLARLLLASKADVNAKKRDGTTALLIASMADHADIVQALLASGADPNATDNEGLTALIASSAKDSVRVVKALLAAGANPNAKATVNNPERSFSFSGGSLAGGTSGKSGGFTALMVAANNGRLEAARALVAAGADVNAANADGKTAVAYASARGFDEIVRLLREAGAK